MHHMPRALVVDDETLIRWALSTALAVRGFDVIEAGDAKTALAALEQSPFDVVFLDYNLPDANDFSLLRTVKRLTPRTCVAIMSADMTPDLEQEALRHGADAVFSKPFDVEAAANRATDVARVGHLKNDARVIWGREIRTALDDATELLSVPLHATLYTLTQLAIRDLSEASRWLSHRRFAADVHLQNLVGLAVGLAKGRLDAVRHTIRIAGAGAEIGTDPPS